MFRHKTTILAVALWALSGLVLLDPSVVAPFFPEDKRWVPVSVIAIANVLYKMLSTIPTSKRGR